MEEERGAVHVVVYTVALLRASTKLFHVGLEKDLGAEPQHILWNLIFWCRRSGHGKRLVSSPCRVFDLEDGKNIVIMRAQETARQVAVYIHISTPPASTATLT